MYNELVFDMQGIEPATDEEVREAIRLMKMSIEENRGRQLSGHYEQPRSRRRPRRGPGLITVQLAGAEILDRLSKLDSTDKRKY